MCNKLSTFVTEKFKKFNMRKVLISIILGGFLILAAYFAAVYYVPYSEGFRAGEVVKISHKGVIFKTWEGRLSQGISDELQFEFSIEDKEKEVIEQLKNLQGKRVKVTYMERFGTFPWLGDTKHFVTKVEEAGEN